MSLFQYSLAEKIEEIEWKAWQQAENFPREDFESWFYGDWIVCYFPVGFSSVLIDRSIQTLKNH